MSNATPVAIQRASSNRKLAPQQQLKFPGGWRRNVPLGPFVTTTYVSIAATCPDSCSFKNNGCYVQAGATAKHGRALDSAAFGWSALDVIREEAEQIDALYPNGVPQDGARGGRDLRLHVGGDVSCAAGAEMLGEAARRWRARGGGRAWTYTHRWRDIPSHAWGPLLSVLASCDSLADVRDAWAAGYAPAVIVPEYPRGHRTFPVGRLTAVPCPVEAGSQLTCATCRLCMDDLALRSRRLVIAFAEHGPGASARRLPVLQGGPSVR